MCYLCEKCIAKKTAKGKYCYIKADRAIGFFKHLKHTKGQWKGVPFQIQPWQEGELREIFGNVDENGNRIIRTVYKTVARKNGKSEEAAGLGLYLLFADNEPNAEIYSAAGDTEQAAIVFDTAVQMIEQCPALGKRCKIIESKRRIRLNKDRSFYRVLSADHATKHGFNAHAVIFDELHTQPNRHLWDVLTTSGGTRAQPLVYSITTAGYDKKSICYEQYLYAKKVLSGIIEDPSFLPIIYELEENDDWKDPDNWGKANPGLHVFRDFQELMSLCSKAKVVPALQNTFRRLYCNQWTEQETKWIAQHSWNRCRASFTEKDLEGFECWGGLDLASTLDIAAFVLLFNKDEMHYVLPYFWCPEDRINQLYIEGKTYYKRWADAGYIMTTPGNQIDYRYIRKTINKLYEKFDIQEIAFDRWGATETQQYLQDDGFEVVLFGQGFASMGAPTKDMLSKILNKYILHNNNPVMNWMIDNTVVKMDPAGNMKPDKSKSGDKIDGVVAMIMSLDRATRKEGNSSIYSERGVISI